MATSKSWQEEARQAYLKAEGAAAHCERIMCIKNTLTLFFLMEMRATLKAKQSDAGADRFYHTVNKAIASVRECPCRIYDTAGLKSLHNMGPVLAGIVQSALWKLYPPDEPCPGEEEEWKQLREERKNSEKAKEAAKRKKRAEANQRVEVTQRVPDQPGPPPPAEPVAQNPPKAKQKDYIPKKGTANYAFLICMFRGHKTGKAHFLKDELMRLAEASGLADMSILGTNPSAGMSVNPQRMYNGWSCLQGMVNRDPPLVTRWSNPVKVRLTPEGEQLASRLFARAVQAGDVEGLPGVDVQSILAQEAAAAPAAPEPKRAAAKPRKAASAAVPEASAAHAGGEFCVQVPSLHVHRESSAAGPSGLARQLDQAAVPGLPAAKRRKLQPLHGPDLDVASDSDALAPPLARPSSQDPLRDACFVLNEHQLPQALPERSTVTATAPPSGVIDLLDSDENDSPAPRSAPAAPRPIGNAGALATGAARASQGMPLRDPTAVSGSNQASCSRPPTLARPAAPQAGSGAAVGSQSASVSAAAPSSPLQSMPARAGVRCCNSWKLPQLDCEALKPGSSGPLAHIRLPPLPPGASFSDVYEIIVLLDNKEQFEHTAGCRKVAKADALEAHAESLRALGLVVCLRNLPVGDIVWVARCKQHLAGGPAVGQEYILDWVIERKRADDLVNSILDGRYSRQKYHMMKCGLQFPMYLIEGNLDDLPTYVKAAKTASVETEIWAGFQVLRTLGVNETKRLYERIARHITCMYRSLTTAHRPRCGLQPLPTFAQWQANVQIEKQTTMRDVWARMLCSLPGIGPETADALVRAFPVPIKLFRALEKCQQDAVRLQRDEQAHCVDMLAAVPISLSRKLGKKSATVLWDELFQSASRGSSVL